MEKWSHRSLDWIHRIREQNYESSKGKLPAEIVNETLKDVEDLRKKLNLRLVHYENIIPASKFSISVKR